MHRKDKEEAIKRERERGKREEKRESGGVGERLVKSRVYASGLHTERRSVRNARASLTRRTPGTWQPRSERSSSHGAPSHPCRGNEWTRQIESDSE